MKKSRLALATILFSLFLTSCGNDVVYGSTNNSSSNNTSSSSSSSMNSSSSESSSNSTTQGTVELPWI